MKSIRILMIGNSFSVSVGQCLPDIVCTAGQGIRLASAYIGGCSLEHHCRCLVRADENAAYRPYEYSVWAVQAGAVVRHSCPGNLREMLRDDCWDVVTIQQASHLGWDASTVQPFADTLVERIRKDQPHARILVQQTWSYNARDPRFNAEWPFGPEGMEERTFAVTRTLADRFGAGLIPTGRAVRIARERMNSPEQSFDRASLKQYSWPDLPPQAGDVAGRLFWRKNDAGELEIGEDDIHLNARGEYLQACVWFGILYDTDPRTIRWSSPLISDADAVFLRECAYDALRTEIPSFLYDSTQL